MKRDYTKLSDREIDALVAERVCGERIWWCESKNYDVVTGRWLYFMRNRANEPVPDYSTNRNACHEALGKLNNKQQGLLEQECQRISIKDNQGFSAVHFLYLTPRQICIAILAALDKEAAPLPTEEDSKDTVSFPGEKR